MPTESEQQRPKPKAEPLELGILTKAGGFIYDPQIQFDRVREQLRQGDLNLNVRNTLFDLINWLAAMISAMEPRVGYSTPSAKDLEDLDRAIRELDSDKLSPKTTISRCQNMYSLKYDSYRVQANDEGLQPIMDQLNREREEVTIRKLWSILRRVTTIAYRVRAFSYHRWEHREKALDTMLDGG